MSWNCYYYYKRPLQRPLPEEDQPPIDDDDNWLPDHIENPHNYNKLHGSLPGHRIPLYNSLSLQADTGKATYGSINDPVLTEEGTSNWTEKLCKCWN